MDPQPPPSPKTPAAAEPPGDARYPNLDRLLSLELPVIAVLAEKSASLDEVLSLREGSVIMFKKNAGGLLDILINDRPIGAGKTIKVGERFGIHVRHVGTPQETLARIR